MVNLCDPCSGDSRLYKDELHYKRSLLTLFYQAANSIDPNVTIPSCEEITQLCEDEWKFRRAILALCCATAAKVTSGFFVETDPVFSAWLAVPPNISIFNNDAGYINVEVDAVFTAWLATNPFAGYVPYVGAIANVDLGTHTLDARRVTAGIPDQQAFKSNGCIVLKAGQRLTFDGA